MSSEFDESKAGMSITSLVCAICAPLFICTGAGWILSAVAVTLGILCYKSKQGIKGVATAGIILGLLWGIPMFVWAVIISGFLTLLGLAAA